jgi:hypothetical protein
VHNSITYKFQTSQQQLEAIAPDLDTLSLLAQQLDPLAIALRDIRFLEVNQVILHAKAFANLNIWRPRPILP